MAIRERLVYAIDIVTDGAKTGLAGFRSAVADADGATGKFKAGASSAFESVKANAGALAISGGAAVVAFGAKAVLAFTESAKASKDMASATGLSIEESSRWIAVADDFEISAGQLTTGLGRISKTLDSTKWSKYGIETRDAAGHARSANDILLDSLDTLGKIENETERARVGNELFGKGYANLAPLIGKTREEYDGMLASVSKGQVITEEEAERAEKARLAYDRMKDALNDLVLEVGGRLAPAFEQLAENISEAAEAAEDSGFLKLIDTISKIPTPIKVVNDGIDLLKDNLGEGERRFDSFANEVDRGSEAISTATEESLRLVHADDDLTKSQNLVNDAIQRSLGPHKEREQQLGDMTRAQNLVNEAIQESQEALRDEEAAYRDNVQAMKAKEDAAYGLHDAEFALETAISRAEEALADESTTLRGARDALEDVVSEAGRVADEQLRAAGATMETKKGMDLWVESMLTSASTLKGPLRDEMLRHISTVSGIPTDVLTKIGIDIDADRLREIEADLNFTARERFVRINPVTGGTNKYASGTKNAARGLALVGEEGPELVEFKGGETVHTAAATASMARSAVTPSVVVNNYRRDLTAADVAQAIQMARLAR